MKKILILVILFAALSNASQRVVVMENFTATWCTYCPGHARALDEIYHRGYDSVVVICYHPSTSDPFYNSYASTRSSYYGISGYPTTYFDGLLPIVGGQHWGTLYPSFRNNVNTRLPISSPLEITLTCTYDSIANTGTVNATILNTTSSTVSGTLHFVVVENNIPHNWQDMTRLDFVMRNMLPNASGEAVSIPASSSINRSRNFTINSAWNENNCKIVVFVQASSKEIYQGAEIGTMQKPNMDYFGLTFNEIAGNNNGVAQPGEQVRLYVKGKNNGDGLYTGGATISESDPYVTITSATPQTAAMGPGDVDTVLIANIDISSSCPSPHLTQFSLNFGTTGDTNTINFLITNQPGFSDNMESGTGNWTHYGQYDNWHLTTYRSHSPTHSWYCGVENTWQYTNMNDAYLVSPYFVVTPDSALKFWHYYNTEADYDYCCVDIDNNCGIWTTLGQFTGTQTSWTQVTFPLNAYAGQTARLRYRFTSDASVTAEGWYIDDIMVPSLVGIDEQVNKSPENALSLRITNPCRTSAVIHFSVASLERMVILGIYDTAGRLVKQWSCAPTAINNQVKWIGDDSNGNIVANGIYLIQLSDGKDRVFGKITLIR